VLARADVVGVLDETRLDERCFKLIGDCSASSNLLSRLAVRFCDEADKHTGGLAV
jgi:hypothetical protein